MQPEKMRGVKAQETRPMPRGAEREALLARLTDARRRLSDRRVGRAWLNGREVGGTEPRLAHLGVSHD